MQMRRIPRLLLCIPTLLCIFGLLGTVKLFTSTPVHAATQASYYVAPNGSDSNPGTIDQPFATIAHARDVIEGINGNMTGDIVVYLRGGTYTQTSTLTFTQSDSGTNGHNIIYQAYNNEIPVISGGQQITGWTLTDSSKNIWQATVGTSLQTRELYVNGVRAQRAQGPMNPSGWTATNTGFTAPDASMASWGNISNIELVYRAGWREARCPVASISGTAVTMQEPCWSSAKTPAYGFAGVTWVENAYELLSSPGQWYLNHTTGILYYIPRSGENMSSVTVIAPAIDTLVSATGTPANPIHNLVFSGITFAYATWLYPNSQYGYADLQSGAILTAANWGGSTTVPGSVNFVAAQHILLQRNTFTHLGAAGVNFDQGSQNDTIDGNVVTDISGNGIELWGPGTSDTTKQVDYVTVQNNYISNVGAEYHDSAGIFAASVNNTTIDHNEINDTPYSGIAEGFTWTASPTYQFNNSITNNRIWNIMQTQIDGGGIYINGNHEQTNTISGNYIYDINNYPGGLYIDNGGSQLTFTNNVVQNVPMNNFVNYPTWMWVGSGASNDTIQNNYSDVSGVSNSGTNITINNNTTVSDGNWPQAALDVMSNAGLQNIDDATQGSGTNQISYGGGWWGHYSINGFFDNTLSQTYNTGGTASIQFSGTGINLFIIRATDQGIDSISIDGGPPVNVDFFAAGYDINTPWASPALSAGTHTLVITVTGTKNPQASLDWLQLDRVQVY